MTDTNKTLFNAIEGKDDWKNDDLKKVALAISQLAHELEKQRKSIHTEVTVTHKFELSSKGSELLDMLNSANVQKFIKKISEEAQ